MNICNGIALKDIDLKAVRRRSGLAYDNLCTLDIEVSTAFKFEKSLIPFSFSRDVKWNELQTYSLLYLWNVCIDGVLFCGRTLYDLFIFLDALNDMLDGTFVIYVHNLSYEFQFLRNILSEMDVFARKKRKPLKAVWKNLEFRCSYMLTRLSLDAWGKEKNLGVKKITGEFDYTKIRTPYTKLSAIERDYGYNDVLVGVCGLQEYLETYKHVCDIPITQTSCIRKTVNKVLRDDIRYRKKLASMTDISFDMYRFLIDCFCGGYTHANVLFTGRTIENVMDYDYSSSYPWAMISEKYPSSKFVKTDRYALIMDNLDRYCFILEVEFTNINSLYFNTYISASKCIEIEGALLDNGRVINAKRVRLRLLDIDYNIIKKTYSIESERVIEFYYATKNYLSDSYCRYIIERYEMKTRLKNLDDKFTLYFKSKEEINGLYGMGVTKDITDEILFNGEWGKELLSVKKYYEKVEKKVRNISKLNFAYSQGIYVPAYGRKNLWSLVYEFDEDIIYMDTDSYKALMSDRFIKAVKLYNDMVYLKHKEIAERLEIDVECLHPRDHRGETHAIGTLERDRDIVKFRTLGAKRYVCQYDAKMGLDYLKMTVAGVRKKAVYQLDTIEDFTDGLVFDAQNAQKMMVVYNDKQQAVTWNEGEYDEFRCEDVYGIAMYNIEYSMGVTNEYMTLIRRVYDERTKIFSGSLAKQGEE